MKMGIRLVLVQVLVAAFCGGLFSLELTDYNYRLNNGIRVKVENGWRKAEVSSVFSNGDALISNRGAVLIRFHVIGDLVNANPDINLTPVSKSKNPAMKIEAGKISDSLAKGKYNASVKFTLQDNNGLISFRLTGIPVKENVITVVTVTLNDIQLTVEEQPGEGWKLSEYIFTTCWSKDKIDGGGYTGYPTIFKAKDRFQMITPAEIESDTKAKIKPGAYDFYLDTDISKARYRYTCWIENVSMESNKTYKFKFNLNGSRVRTETGVNPNQIGFYPVGTAATQKPRENKKLLLYKVVDPVKSALCPTGTYDILVSYDYGSRNEWRTNVVFEYGVETVIK